MPWLASRNAMTCNREILPFRSISFVRRSSVGLWYRRSTFLLLLLRVYTHPRDGRLLVLARPAHASGPYGRPAPRAPPPAPAPRTPPLDLGEAAATALGELRAQLPLSCIQRRQRVLRLDMLQRLLRQPRVLRAISKPRRRQR